MLIGLSIVPSKKHTICGSNKCMLSMYLLAKNRNTTAFGFLPRIAKMYNPLAQIMLQDLKAYHVL